jgi:F0F1-type ATP synthase membrane subunit b/b'
MNSTQSLSAKEWDVEHFDWLLGFWFPYINFAIFLVLAVYFLRKPLANFAAKRRNGYLAAVKAANEAKELATAKLLEIDARLASLDKEIAMIWDSSEKEAEREAAKIIESANRLATHLKAEAQRIADAEILRAKQELRRTVMKEVKAEVEKKIAREFAAPQQKAYTAARTISLQTLSTRI